MSVVEHEGRAADGSSRGGSPADAAVELSPMRRRHLRGVLRIEGQQTSPGWSLGLFMSELSRPDDRCYLVARRSGSVVGFAGMLFTADGGHVTTMAVDEAHRRARIGSRLLLGLVRDALERPDVDALTLEVRAGNRAAQRLYSRFGFAPVGARRDYYREPREDAIVMWTESVRTDEYRARLDRIAGTLGGPGAAEGTSR